MLKFYMAPSLPQSLRVIVRGWLNCNQVVMLASRDNLLVDSGYCTHREQSPARLAGPAGGGMAGRGLHPGAKVWARPDSRAVSNEGCESG